MRKYYVKYIDLFDSDTKETLTKKIKRIVRLVSLGYQIDYAVRVCIDKTDIVLKKRTKKKN